MLDIELVPATCWWSNVRSNVSRAEWEKCKTYARAKTDGCCIICGGVGRGKWPTEAHEIWHYDDSVRPAVQTLVDIWPLCPTCHKVKHLGRTRTVSGLQEWTRVLSHLQRVNQWDDVRLEREVNMAFAIWEMRSRLEWKLDISFLETIGIDLTNKALERPRKANHA